MPVSPAPSRFIAPTAALLGALAVALGAFGAHGLKGRLSPDALAWWHTAATYHLIHALAMLAVGLAVPHLPRRSLALAGWLFGLGVAIFSGSLYTMALTEVRWLGAITPLGGLAFIAAWLLTAFSTRPPKTTN